MENRFDLLVLLEVIAAAALIATMIHSFALGAAVIATGALLGLGLAMPKAQPVRIKARRR